MNQRSSTARAGATLAIAALFASVIAAGTSLLLTSRLSNEDALRADMTTVVESVSDQVIAHTESVLSPAIKSTDFLGDFIADEIVDPTDPSAPPILLGAIATEPTVDGFVVGSADGQSLYVSRSAAGSGSAYRSVQISLVSGELTTEVVTYDESLVELSREVTPALDYDPRTRTWYTQAVEAGEGTWTEPYVFFSGGLGVTRSAPVYSGDVVTHVVGVDIRLASLSDFMAERAPSMNGSAFIMTRSQIMVAHPSADQIVGDGQLHSASHSDDPVVVFAGEIIANDSGRNEFVLPEVDEDGADPGELTARRGQYVLTPLRANPDWVVAAWSPESDFFTEVRRTTRTNSMIALGLGLVILLELLAVAAWVYRKLMLKDRHLTNTSDERDQAQRELAQTVVELRTSNRNLEEYAYATAHDLRTPLRSIGGYGELIERELQTDNPDLTSVQQWAQRVVDGYVRMGRTMDNLLEHARFSAAGQDQFELVNTKQIAESVARDLRPQLDEIGGSITIGELPDTYADSIRVYRVFQNLVENSIRFRDPTRPLRIEVQGSPGTGLAQFTVRDNGIGISSIDQAHVFDSFRTIHAHANGVGLGLALVKRIVEEHGGEISLASIVSQETTFTFSLPTAADRPETPPAT